MAIQMRRGLLADYDEDKMVAGELAVTTDAMDADQQVYVAFAPGDSKRILTESDIVPQLVQNIWTGTCSTASGTAAKVVTLDNSEGFTLARGKVIIVTFTAYNSASNPTMNVNGTGAKPICCVNSSGGAGNITTGSIKYFGAGAKLFYYNGFGWAMSTTDSASIMRIYNEYAPLASPALTGTPTAPTAAAGTNTTQIATTAFVQNEIDDYAPLASPALTGTPTAPTAASGTNTTQIATTAFVQTAIDGFDAVTITDPNNDGHLVITIGGN